MGIGFNEEWGTRIGFNGERGTGIGFNGKWGTGNGNRILIHQRFSSECTSK